MPRLPRKNQIGGAIAFHKRPDGRVWASGSKGDSDDNAEHRVPIEFEIFTDNDYQNLELLQTSILPLLQFNKYLFSARCNARQPLDVRTSLKTVNEGGFGIGFTFDCTYFDNATGKAVQTFFMKLANPKNVRYERQHHVPWRQTSVYEEHYALKRFGIEHASPFVIRYFGFVDLTGMRESTNMLFTSHLFDEADAVVERDMRAIRRAVALPSNVFVLFTESLDFDLFGQRATDLVEALLYLCDIALALHTLHAEGYVHCDIKPSNMMVKRLPKSIGDRVHKLIDLGAVSPAGQRQRVHTPGYQDRDFGKGKPDTYARDMYALGVSLYDFLGMPLDELDAVQTKSEQQITRLVTDLVAKLPNQFDIDRDKFVDLLASLCHPQRTQRPKAFIAARNCFRLLPPSRLIDMVERYENIYHHYDMRPSNKIMALLCEAQASTYGRRRRRQ